MAYLLKSTQTAVKTANYTAAFGETVRCDPSGGGFTVTLPTPGAGDVGRSLRVKNVTSSTNNITADGAGANVDGASTLVLSGAYFVAAFEWDGTDWHTMTPVAFPAASVTGSHTLPDAVLSTNVPLMPDVLGFNPSKIANLNYWFEAGWLSGYSAGAQVPTLTDLSWNGNDFVCGATAPTYQTNVVNGRPALLWGAYSSGSDQRYDGPASMTVGTVVIAAYYNLATFSDYDGLFGELGSNIYFTGTGSGTGWFSPRGSLTLYKDNAASSTSVTNAWHVFSATDSSPLASQFEIGRDRNQTGRAWHGYVYGLATYSTALSAAQRKLVERYFGAKVGITI